MSRVVADVSVRPARVEDAPEIARVQVETWRTAYADLLPETVLDAATVERASSEWSAAVGSAPTVDHRVLVAQEQRWLVGFAAFGPAEPDPDDAPADRAGRTGQVHALLVEPRWGRRGHGSRLLAATVEGMRAAGMTRALVWLAEGDRASTRFFSSAGWEPDGYVRTMEDGGRVLREARYHVSLEDHDADGVPDGPPEAQA